MFNNRWKKFLVVGVFAIFVLNASQAFAISRNEVLSRAQKWMDNPVPYSQSKYFGGYRTDCSGYASMAWHTLNRWDNPTSWATRTFYAVTHKITVSQLKPGDAFLKPGYHIRLFIGWVDDTHDAYLCYEQTGPQSKYSIKSALADMAYGYTPTRYDDITDSPKPNNVLVNPSFNFWAKNYSTAPEINMWWKIEGSTESTLTIRRRDIYHDAKNAIQLNNPNSDSSTYTIMSQEASITAGFDYDFSVWALTQSNPDALSFEVSYLDALGQIVNNNILTASSQTVNSQSLSRLHLLTSAPDTAVKALVKVKLAGGSSTTTTTTIPGTSAVIDNISLARPTSSVSIKSNVSRTYIGRTATLSGVVTPSSAINATGTVYIKKPGGSWSRYQNPIVGTDGKWKSSYAFRRGARKGTYYFKMALPPSVHYLGITSKTVSVVLK